MSAVTQRELTMDEIVVLRAKNPGIDLLLSEGGHGIFTAHSPQRGLLLMSVEEGVKGLVLEGGTRERRTAILRDVVYSVRRKTGGQAV